jgi:hypothetical protein
MVHRNENRPAGDGAARQEIQSGRIGAATNSQTKTKVKHTAGIAVVSVDEDNDCLYLNIELNNDCAVVLAFPKNKGETPYLTIWRDTQEEPFEEGPLEKFRLWAELAAGVINRETYFDRIGACADCGVGPFSIKEYYMVEDYGWARAQGGTDLLCIGCLEKRIGRTLTRSDFGEGASVNGANTFRRRFSDRLRARLISDKSRAVP